MIPQPKFTAKQAADYAFRKRHSLHKVWIALADGETKTHYASDCSATILQMSCGRVTEVTLSYSKGLEDCRKKEKYFRGRYRTVVIYRRCGRDWKETHKYVAGNLVEESTDQPTADEIKCSIEITDSGIQLKSIRVNT